MKPILVLVHGWAVDKAIFDRLELELSDYEIIKYDLGFFGRPEHPEIPSDRPVIAIGYSLGFLWLLHEQPFKWDGLISIGSFTRFTRMRGFMGGVLTMVLEGMKVRLGLDPKGLLKDVYQQCGFDRDVPEGYDARQLHQGLNWLKNWDMREVFHQSNVPVLALAASDDPVVPESLTKASFEGKCDLVWSPDGGGHGLPVTRSQWCADQIRQFAQSFSKKS